jgi:hypothetical protein
MIKKLMSCLYKSNCSKKLDNNDIENVHHKDSLVDIIVSLTKDGEIDLSVFIDAKKESTQKGMFEYAKKCAEFLNIATGEKIKPQITSIILDQIRNEDNQFFIENVIMFWALLDKETKDKKELRNSKTYIYPSQVFSRHAS